MKATLLLRLSLFTILCLPFAPLFCAIDVDVNIYAVGQGNGVLVKGGDHAMLIDAGSVTRHASEAPSRPGRCASDCNAAL